MDVRRLCAMVLIIFVSVTPLPADGEDSPGIEILSVPPFGVWGVYLGGVVSGVDPATHRIVVYIYIPGVGWYTKPYFDPACTAIQSGGVWSALVTTGGIDDQATIFAAVLIPASACSDPGILADGSECLPDRIDDLALASDCALRKNPNQRTVSFSGREWLVKSCDVRCGPGNNYFSDSADNVWVDAQGRLHLKITYRDAKWQCAEVVAVQPLGYGTYAFDIDTPVNDLDPNIILGLFTYSEECVLNPGICVDRHREIDIEFSKWGDPESSVPAQFVVQPWTCDGHRERFGIPSGSSRSFFSWWPGLVQFQTAIGEDVYDWVFSDLSRVPEPLLEQTRINLYLMEAAPPTDGQEKEVVISRFRFVPPLEDCALATLKTQSDQTPVRAQGKIVSAAFADYFYIESDQRESGIRVEKPGHGLVAGVRADVTGTVQTNAHGERFVLAASTAENGSGSVKPLGMLNRSLGGGEQGLQAGVTEAVGLNNIGLLIRVWGKVTDSGADWFVVDDGSGAEVKCSVPSGTVIDPGWAFAAVTGVSSCEKSDGVTRTRLLVRGQEDITAF